MTWSSTEEGQENMLNAMYRGTYGTTSTSNYYILTSGYTPNFTSTAGDAIAAELLEKDGYSRELFAPSAPTTTSGLSKFPDYTMAFTNGNTSSELTYNNVALIYGGSSRANSTVSAISTDAILTTTASNGISNNDRVLFTVDGTGTGAANITLSTPGNVTLYYATSVGTGGNTLKIATSAGGSAITLGTAIDGSLIIHNANGVLDSYDPEVSTIQIAAGGTSTVTVTGFGVES